MRLVILFAIFNALSFGALSQSLPYTLPVDPTNQNVYPPAPETSAFTKYGSYPVARETGIPNISIPLHTVAVGELSLPISLSYHASGIKVDQKASWVGLGWDLNVGGVVSRVVKGYPDELPDGYLNKGVPQSMIDFEPFDDLKYQTIKRMIAGEYDTEPDEFNFSFPGASGRFFLDASGEPIVQPFSDYKIEYTITDYKISAFEIIAPDGIKYKFGIPSKTLYHTNYLLPVVEANTTWYLMEISSHNDTDKVNLNYTTTFEYEPSRKVETEYLTMSYEDGLYMGYTKETKLGYINYTFSSVKAIESIVFTTGKVVFNSSAGRSDFPSELKLDAINVYGADQVSVTKGFDLTYGYFAGTGGSGAPPENNLRLKLFSVQERGQNGESIPPYQFTYLESGLYQLPQRYANSQDFWGYNNGKLNTSLLPLYHYITPPSLTAAGEWIDMGSADRDPDGEKMKSGILHSIDYPTGGKTEFDFEANAIKRTFSKPIFDTNPYHAEIYPPFGGNPPATEVLDYIPEAGQTLTENKTFKLTYRILEILGTLSSGDMSVGVEDVTTGSPVSVFAHLTKSSEYLTTSVNLLAGHTYRLYVRSSIDQVNKKGIATIEAKGPITYQTVTENTAVGGLRIKSIKNFDKQNVLETQKFYDYNFPEDPNFSSGRYNSIYTPTPNAFLQTKEIRYSFLRFVNGPENPPTCHIQTNAIVSLTANPAYFQGYPSGNLVNYEYVTEYPEDQLVENTAGKTVYKYDLQIDESVELLMPLYAFNVDKSWLRGQLRLEQHLNKNENMIRSVEYDYELQENVHPTISGFRIGEWWSIGDSKECVTCELGGPCISERIQQQRRERIKGGTYFLQIQWKRLKTITEIQDGIQKVTTLDYNSTNQHTNVTASEVANSDAKITRTEIKYTHELNETELLNRNIVSQPLQSDIFVNTMLTRGNRITYGLFGSNYLPQKFEERLTDGTYSETGKVDAASARGRITLSHGRDGVYDGILWGHNDELPLAKIMIGRAPGSSTVTLNPTYSTVPPGVTTRMQFAIAFTQDAQVSTEILDPGNVIAGNENIYKFYIENLDNGTEKYFHKLPGTQSATVRLEAGNYALKSNLTLGSTQNIVTIVNVALTAKELFHTSFEEFDGVNDADAKTGRRTHSGNYVIHGKGLIPGQYILSYFENTGSGWILNKSTLTHDGSTDITLTSSGKIDEVRIHPVGSQIETTAYDPVRLTITSKTDINNSTTYYDYDNFSRLRTIKDDKGNLLKQFTYHYSEQ